MLQLLQSNVTHEMMTPLNCIVKFAQQLLGKLSLEEDRKFAKLIIQSGSLLKFQVKDLLDKSLLQNKQLELIETDGDVVQTLREIVDVMQLQAKVREIKLCLSVESLKESWYKLDHSRLQQIAVNLLSNAIKFSN
jgi:signal transduction histidine kinase